MLPATKEEQYEHSLHWKPVQYKRTVGDNGPLCQFIFEIEPFCVCIEAWTLMFGFDCLVCLKASVADFRHASCWYVSFRGSYDVLTKSTNVGVSNSWCCFKSFSRWLVKLFSYSFYEVHKTSVVGLHFVNLSCRWMIIGKGSESTAMTWRYHLRFCGSSVVWYSVARVANFVG